MLGLGVCKSNQYHPLNLLGYFIRRFDSFTSWNELRQFGTTQIPLEVAAQCRSACL
jgi:hypothetical protein